MALFLILWANANDPPKIFKIIYILYFCASMAVSRREFTELSDSVKELSDSVKALVEQSAHSNMKLDALIALHRGVATTGTLIPAKAQDQVWLRKFGQLCKRSKGRKTDVVVLYYLPQLMANSKHRKSE